jgi:ribosomal protein L40E
MGPLRYEPKESGEEWASRKGYLARIPDTHEPTEKQKHRRIEAEKKHKEIEERFHEIIAQVNKVKGQAYVCGNCNAKVRINYNYCEKCGSKLIWQTEL